MRAKKAAIRAAALGRRDALDPALRREYGRAILERIMALDEFQSASAVLAYHGFGSEIDTIPLLAAALARGKRLLLPRVNRAAGALDIYEVKNLETDLRAGVWGIREPDSETCALCGVSEAGLIVVPGAAFDRKGGRIGYGRGYYDKLLASSRAAGHHPLAVAGAFEAQIVEAIPMEPHDERADLLVTEAGAWPAGA